MPALCMLTSLLQFVILVAMTGILVSVAAVTRLMELTITFMHLLTIFMLHQSGKLVIFGVSLSAHYAWYVYKKMCMKRRDDINIHAPDLPYYRCSIPGLVDETKYIRDGVQLETWDETVAAGTAAAENEEPQANAGTENDNNNNTEEVTE